MSDLRKLKAKEIKEVKLMLIEEQGGVCPLCLIPFSQLPSRDWCLDHDHKTGAVRGVLCRNCNGNEGRILKRVTMSSRGKPILHWLSRLYHYLDTHKVNKTGLLHPTFKTPAEKRAATARKAALSRKKAKAKK